jgi:hypothetical protein
MAQQLNLQRNTKVFLSAVNIQGDAVVTAMTPSNTWQIDILAGYAMSQAAATQDITSAESGLTPDRSQQRFLTAINPVDWNFQCYVKPTGLELINGTTPARLHHSGNVMPVADWFLWQALMSNTAPFNTTATGTQSAWANNGTFSLASRSASSNVYLHNPNFATASELHLYFKMDNVIYQVANATVNQATVDAAIDGIATTTWTGFGTTLHELTDTKRTNAVSVFGGIVNAATTVAANSNVTVMSRVASYHPWNSYNVSSTATAASFIKSRLSSLVINHATDAVAAATEFTFPITSLSFDYTNNITYLSPEEISTLNQPIGQFSGTRAISGSLSAYLRSGTDTSTFLKQIVEDTRTSSAATSNANLKIGGATAPFMALWMPAVQFDIPTHAIDDVVGVSFNFLAQETTSGKGTGDELTIVVTK